MNPTLLHEIAQQRMADNLREAKNARLAKQATEGKANGYKLTERAAAKVTQWFTTPEAAPKELNPQFEV